MKKIEIDIEKDMEQNVAKSLYKKKSKRHRGRRKKKSQGNLLSNIILVIAIGVFCFAAYNLWEIFSEYRKGSSEYESLQNLVIKYNAPEASEEDLPSEEMQFQVDFAALKEINSDVVAWLRFEEPSVISYPVVLGIDNDKYLTTTFEGKKNAAGTLFIDMVNSGDFSDRNTFIYGHNMKNGAMFGRLREYKSADFYKAHPYFYIYTPDGKESTYQVFSVAIVKDTSDSYTKVFASDEEYADYLQYIKGLSRYDTGVEVDAGSQIVSLSTCTNVRDDERLLVHGVKISEKMIEE